MMNGTYYETFQSISSASEALFPQDRFIIARESFSWQHSKPQLKLFVVIILGWRRPGLLARAHDDVLIRLLRPWRVYQDRGSISCRKVNRCSSGLSVIHIHVER
jgi:hypothetical protein